MDLRVGLLPHPHLQRNLAFQWGYRTLQALTYPGHLKTMKGLATLLVRFPGPSIHVLQCKEQMGAWAQPASFLHWHLPPVANSFGGPARPPLAIVCLSARSCHTGLSTWPLPFSNIARERKCLEQVRQSDCLISGNAILVLTSHHLIFYYLEASYRSSSYSRGGDYTRA